MPSLTKHKEVFNSVANADVVSSSAPTGDVGVSKTVGEKGFFIKSQTSFALWFKDEYGVWNNSNNSATTGFYEWQANQSFYIQSDSNQNFFVFKRNETPAARAVVKRADKTNRNRAFDTATSHTNVASSWTTSGHQGEPYSIGLFGLDGAGSFLSAPPSGQREGKILGWDDNGDMGWIAAPTSSVDVLGETAGIENEAALHGNAYFSHTGAVVLDGAGDHLKTDSNYHFPDQFQASAGFKTTNLDNDWQCIMGTRKWDGSANGFVIQLKDGKFRVLGPQSDNTTLDVPVPAGTDLNDGEWHEVELKWVKDTELSLFLDGEKLHTHVPSGTARPGVKDLEIGRNPDLKSRYFEGEIDGVKVENEVQTEQEILNEFIAKVLGNSPSPADYNGIEDLGTTTMVNGASLQGSGHLALDGSNYAQADSNHHYGDYLTATAWFRTVKHQTGFGVLFSSRKWNGSGNGFALAIKDGGIHLHHPQTNNTHLEPAFDHVELSDGEWHQAVLRWKADEDLSAFIDGVKVGSLVPAGGINAGAFDLLIGTEPLDFTGMFVGHIDGVKVENVYKSDNEIMAEFTGNPLLTLLGSNPMGAISLPVADPGATAIDHPDGDLTAQITSDWDTVVGANPAMGDYVVTYSVTDSDGNQDTATRAVTIGDGLEDIAALNGAATLPSGILVPGSNGYGSLASSTDYDLDGGDMTVHFWFKANTLPASIAYSLVAKMTGGNTWNGWGIHINPNGSFNSWNSSTGGGNRSSHFGSTSDWNLGEWVHMAVVHSTANPYEAYINGQLVSTFTPNSKSTVTDTELLIGASRTTNGAIRFHFDGEMKKVKITKSALSAADVLAEYNAGAPPELTLLGANPLVLGSLNDSDPGATATDAVDGDLTAQITSDWDSVINGSTAAGVHNIAYSVTDSDGNLASETRTVWNGTIEDFPSTTLYGGATRTDGVLTLDGEGYALADSKHHYADHFYLETWFKTDSLQVCTNVNNWTNMIVLASSRAWNGSWNGFTIGMASNHINIHHPSNNSVVRHDLAGYVINDNVWHHIALQWIHNGETALYIDGQKRQTWNTSGTAKEGSRNVNIGRDPYSGNFRMIADIDKFMITNAIMTDAQVLNNYNSNAPGSLTLLGDQSHSITSLPANDPGATALDSDGGDLTAQINSDWDTVIGNSPNNGDYTVTYSVTDSNGNYLVKTRDVNVAVPAIYPDSPFIEEWPFRATPIGSVTGVIQLNDAERILPNPGDVTVPASEFAHITDTYTISFWMKSTAARSGSFELFDTNTDAAYAHGDPRIAIDFDTYWRRMRFHSGLSAATFRTANDRILSDNSWTHIVLTVSGDGTNVTSKVYKNNTIQVNSSQAQTNASIDWTGNVLIDPPGNIELNSFQIVDQALTESEIASLYAGGQGTKISDILTP